MFPAFQMVGPAENERAAAHRLAGFGDQVEVLTPPSVRAALVTTAQQILRRYHATNTIQGGRWQ